MIYDTVSLFPCALFVRCFAPVILHIYSTRGNQNEKYLLGFKCLYFRRLLVSSIYLLCTRLTALFVWFVVRVLWFVFDAGKVRNVVSLLEYVLKTTPPLIAKMWGGYICSSSGRVYIALWLVDITPPL